MPIWEEYCGQGTQFQRHDPRGTESGAGGRDHLASGRRHHERGAAGYSVPQEFAAGSAYAAPGYPYIHKELARSGMTLTLLWT